MSRLPSKLLPLYCGILTFVCAGVSYLFWAGGGSLSDLKNLVVNGVLLVSLGGFVATMVFGTGNLLRAAGAARFTRYNALDVLGGLLAVAGLCILGFMYLISGTG